MNPKLFSLLLYFIAYIIPISANEPVSSYEYEIAIVSVFRDEADWLDEWVRYHLGIGVEHFYLYNHNSKDDYKDVLKPYIDSGIVEVFPAIGKKHPASQYASIKDAIARHKHDVKWLACIDVDEFIVLHKKKNIRRFLKDYERSAGVVMNWQLFGTSNVDHLDRNESMLLALTWKFPTYFDHKWNSNRFVKSIIRPDRIDEKTDDRNCGNHIFMPIEGYFIVNSNNEPQPILSRNPSILVDKIQLNHYWTRTYEWFYKTKISRRAKYGEKFSSSFLKWLFSQSHKEQDLSIQKNIK